jgi:hypothetical protein
VTVLPVTVLRFPLAPADPERSAPELIPYARCRNVREDTAILMPAPAWS